MQDQQTWAIIILAAGSSSRYGSPKQLVVIKDKSLLLHAVDTALQTGCKSVFVVLGSEIDLMKNELNNKPVTIVDNTAWEEGMASSIRCGLATTIKEKPSPSFVIFMVCDQPFVSSSLLLKLVEMQKETELPIVACNYGNDKGTPALFHQVFFPSLMKLKGDKGAQKIINDHPGKVASVFFPEGTMDIDTKKDFEILNKNSKSS